MYFQNLRDKFDVLETEKNYWFVRTNKGQNFDSFQSQGYIGIGWNYITTQDLREKSEEEIKGKIATNEQILGGTQFDSRSQSGKTKITSIYNKIRRFQSLSSGDLIIIPSKGSEFLAFGYISDDIIYNNFDDIDCDYHKRRKVNWIVTERLKELDAIFYKIIFSKHAVSKLNGYAKYIDKVVSNVFIKDEQSHLVLDVATADNIPVEVLYGMITSVRNLTELINTNFDLGDSLSENAIKLNLQSPGNIEFIYNRGKSLLVLSLILSLPIVVSCSHPSASLSAESSSESVIEKNGNIEVVRENIDSKSELSDEDKEGINDFFENNYDTIAEAKHQMDILKVKVDKLNSIN